MPEIRRAQDAAALANAAADFFVDAARRSISLRGRFMVALSGGSTPKALYSLLASDEYRSRVNWSRVVFFLGDERYVPDTDVRSNYRMARETLFEPLWIDEANVNVWITGLSSPDEVAAMYELSIQMAFDRSLDPARDPADEAPLGGPSSSLPVFDLVLLGLGPDGHTASLFPHTKALHETEKMAVPNWVDQLDELRFTLTYPVINNSANVMFLVSGDKKADIVKKVIEGEYSPDDLPAQRISPTGGALIWMLDDAAASHLRPQ